MQVVVNVQVVEDAPKARGPFHRGQLVRSVYTQQKYTVTGFPGNGLVRMVNKSGMLLTMHYKSLVAVHEQF